MCPRGVIMERSRPNFSHAAGVLVGKWTRHNGLERTVAAQVREMGTLSRAIHFEHVPLGGQTETPQE